MNHLMVWMAALLTASWVFAVSMILYEIVGLNCE